jgi:hypothetical protein
MAQRSKLSILPLKTPPKERPPQLDENLPAPQFVMMLVGGCGSGKTVTLANLLLREDFYRGIFDHVELVSPTARNDDSMSPLLASKGIRHHSLLTDDLVLRLLAEQDSRVEKAAEDGKKPQETLWVLDDSLGSESFGPRSPLSKLIAQHRHHHLSIIVAGQLYKFAAPVLRANLTSLLVWHLSDGEIKKLVDEWGGTFPRLPELLAYATREKYSFLNLRMRGGHEARVRFDGPLIWSSDDRYSDEFKTTSRLGKLQHQAPERVPAPAGAAASEPLGGMSPAGAAVQKAAKK